jgi:hypothetical protein
MKAVLAKQCVAETIIEFDEVMNHGGVQRLEEYDQLP